jgi:hypothetical protein
MVASVHFDTMRAGIRVTQDKVQNEFGWNRTTGRRPGPGAENAARCCHEITPFHCVRGGEGNKAQAGCGGNSMATGQVGNDVSNGIMRGVTCGGGMAGVIQEHVCPRVNWWIASTGLEVTVARVGDRIS